MRVAKKAHLLPDDHNFPENRDIEYLPRIPIWHLHFLKRRLSSRLVFSL